MVDNELRIIPPGYTAIPEELIKERDELCVPTTIGVSPSLSKAKEFTSYFMYHQFGYKPYAWQHMLFKEVRAEDKDILVNTIRQAGKTFALEILSIQYAIYNLKPVPSKGYTVIGIASSSEDQQKKIIADIRDILDRGDTHLYEKSGGKMVKYFTSHLSRLQTDTNNKTQLTFRKVKYNPLTKKRESIGSVLGIIKCVPATKSARGNTFSLLFMDEAAFFDEDDFFDTVARPTLKASDGRAVITTTPNGQKGWFFKVFDPFLELEYNPFYKMWLHYTHIEDDYEYSRVLDEKKRLLAQGSEKQFQQEYEAMFTADNIAFFESDKVDSACDPELVPWDSYSKTTDMGIDFGFKTCNTVITISRYGEDGVSRLIFDKIYPPEQDLNVIDDVLELKERFNVNRVIIDECIHEATEVVMADNTRCKIKDIKPGDYVKSYNFESKKYVNKKVTDVIFKGKRGTNEVSFRNGTKVYATNGHEWFVKNKQTNNLSVKNTTELDSNSDYIPTAYGVETNTESFITKEEAYLLGMYISEGHIRPNKKSFFISQLREDMRYKIKENLSKTSWKWQENKKGFYLSNVGVLTSIFLKCGKSCYEKKIPEDLFTLCKDLLESLYEGIIDGDGWRLSEKQYKNKKQSARIGFSTSSEQLDKDIRYLAFLIGKFMNKNTPRIHSGFGSQRLQYESCHNENNYFNKGKAFIKEVKFFGICDTYDLRIEDTQSFILADSGVITHNCPAASFFIQQAKKKSLSLHLMSFKRDKQSKYFLFRSKMYKGNIQFYPHRRLESEMKSLTAVEQQIGTKITKPKGGSDDVIDSFLMSVYFQIEDKKGFTIYDWDDI